MLVFDPVGRSPIPLADETLASMSSRVAVVDGAGVILAVNEAWVTFGMEHGVEDIASIGPRANYFDVCQRAEADGDAIAAAVRHGIEGVCTGCRPGFELVYRVDTPKGAEWYEMSVTPLRHEGGGAVVAHRNISALKRREIARRQRTIADRRKAETKLRDLAGRLVSAHEEERRRIARDLHDDINQRLALLAIQIDELIIDKPDAAVLDASLHDLSRHIGEISRAVHDLSHELHSSALEALGLRAALRTLAAESSRKGLHVYFADEGGSGELSPDAALCLFRIVQEALTNVAKHAGVADATLRLFADRRHVGVRVEDHGCGFDPHGHSEGLGLLSMRERLLPFGGQLEIGARVGGGTVVEARVPKDACQ